MKAFDQLLTMSELAIGLAGFAGVVVAFARGGKLATIDRWRFAGLLSLAMGAAVMAYVPLLLDLTGVSGPALWRASSGVFLGIGVLFIAIFPSRAIRALREADAPLPWGFLLPTFGLSAANLLLQLLNALGWPFNPGPLLFVAGILTWLVVVALFFGILVLGRPD